MDVTSTVALVLAGASTVVTLVGLQWEKGARQQELKTQREQLEREHEQWRAEFERAENDRRTEFEVELAKERAGIRKEFDLAQYEHRAATFAPVFATLGAVRDVPDPINQDHWRELRDKPDVLAVTAQQLLEHLYGEPGLFMHFDTRNRLLKAYVACVTFQAQRISLEELVQAFYFARRFLREDLNLIDGRARVRLEDTLKDVNPPTVRGAS